ncbi:phage major tail tube protein [Devosia ginsengisoli]|uniref:phage major tail tube protein n=1 Tax=Devosia ginsengisoli TaxID=400770 RepID=UPI0026EF43C4|nr:phage major tail tube protein [Devosia ginsengisoli]MCR6673223.1 phage major tail tube protein [Devosia ginsengisoli]
MSGTVYLMEAANLFCGLHDPTKSKHLTLAELKLPDLQAIYADHHAGGALVATEFEVGIQKFEPTFKLNGFDPDLLTQFGLGKKSRETFTAYGAIRDQRSGKTIEAKSIIEARLGRVAPDAFQRGEMMGHEYAMNSVMHYELWFDGAEKIAWDFFTSVWRVDGVDQNEDVNRILRIPGVQ